MLNRVFHVRQSRAGDDGTLFPAFQACKDGLPCITKKARAGVCVGGGTPQRLTTLFPELGAVMEPVGLIRVHRAVSSM